MPNAGVQKEEAVGASHLSIGLEVLPSNEQWQSPISSFIQSALLSWPILFLREKKALELNTKSNIYKLFEGSS